ncbi:SurA N-terminal domain-containing protein [Moraxella atlantae]|uniref:Periplasmic chaperone PpiD n=1 Tax=Faucicola atlantae TaxID=34059 RepID=A0A378Q879_9GAMM|nr:SurA N-terminal domain-containing protein [Moraxella atlantae]OPH33578.1 peptidylprolyl isomerase [Moraxella atlantae]STY95417.1 Peptidyl-prolyl cis-trans isomerase D [Moraxella atlantae]
MERLREFLQGWVGKSLLVLFMLPLAVTGVESIRHSGDDPNAVAKVGELNVPQSALQNAINQRRQSLLAQVGGDTSLINDEILRKQTLESMIDRYLIANQSQNLGFSVSDAAITQMLATEPTFLDESGQFSQERFASFLQQQGMSKEQLFDTLRQDMTLSTFSRGVINTAVYPLTGVDKLLSQQTQLRPVWVARVPWQPFAAQVQVSDAQINQYYQQHRDQLNSDDAVDLAYVMLDKNALPAPAPSEAQVQAAYQQYIANNPNAPEYDVSMILINDPNAQATLNQLKTQLDNKQADFAALAKQYSQDEGSKNNGGNIGTISQAMFPKDYAAVLAAVKGLQVGQVSAPVKTQYGYQLFKLNNISGDAPPDLATMRPTLIAQLQAQAQDAQYQDLISKINNDAVADVGVEQLAKRYRLSAHTLPNYQTTHAQGLNQPAVMTAAFDPQLRGAANGAGHVSTGIDLKDRTVWVQPNNYRAAHAMTLAEARPMIKQKLVQQQAQALALARAKQIAAAVQQKNSVEGVGVEFSHLGDINRQNPALSDAERASAFSVPARADKLAVTTQATPTGASVLVGGVIHQDASAIDAASKRQAANMVRDAIGQSQFEDYLAYLRAHTDVTIKNAPANNP